MSMHLLASGTIAADPQRRQSAKGGTFTTASVRVGTGDEATFVNVIAFGDAAERLLTLTKGDAVSVAGRAELKRWTTKDGAERSGLSVVANEVAAAKPQPRKREAAPPPPSPDAAPRTPRSRPPLPPYDGSPLDDRVDDLYVEREI